MPWLVIPKQKSQCSLKENACEPDNTKGQLLQSSMKINFQLRGILRVESESTRGQYALF